MNILEWGALCLCGFGAVSAIVCTVRIQCLLDKHERFLLDLSAEQANLGDLLLSRAQRNATQHTEAHTNGSALHIES